MGGSTGDGSAPVPPEAFDDPGMARERTALSWVRTGLALSIAALGVGRLALIGVGAGVVLPVVLALAAGLWVLLSAARSRSAEPHAPHLSDGRLPGLATGALLLLVGVEASSLVAGLLRGIQ